MSRKNKSHKRKCSCCGFLGKFRYKVNLANNEIQCFIKNMEYRTRGNHSNWENK